MFPLTPVRLGEGFIEGRERIVSCVSRQFSWPRQQRPRILLFDLDGRTKDHNINEVQTEGGWAVDIELDDWQNIAVIASSP